MFKVLGVDTSMIRSGKVFKDMLIELSKRKKGRPHFMELVKRSEFIFRFDSVVEVGIFEIKLPNDVPNEDVAFMEDFVTRCLKATDESLFVFKGVPQKAVITIIASEEPNIIGTRSPHLRKKSMIDE